LAAWDLLVEIQIGLRETLPFESAPAASRQREDWPETYRVLNNNTPTGVHNLRDRRDNNRYTSGW